jgi:(p)ppGpp synthase/HD superfamily hydrolase
MKHILLPTLEQVSKALLMASYYHSEQRRKYDGSPYINHLIEVMSLLIDVGGITSADTLCAAILHDALEDTNLSAQVVEQEFNAHVRQLIINLTDDKELALEERRKVVLNKLRFAQHESKCIKLADICSNIASIPGDWCHERVMSYVTWLDEVALICKDANLFLFGEYQQRRYAAFRQYLQ